MNSALAQNRANWYNKGKIRGLFGGEKKKRLRFIMTAQSQTLRQSLFSVQKPFRYTG